MRDKMKLDNIIFGIIPIIGIISTVLLSTIGIFFYAFNLILVGFIVGFICILIDGLMMAINIKKEK